ncbi:hypothetical protein [Pseudophaeobacter sp.]|uniref:hypothetical protein n=1 Tax=Pseudophaeobacter sp. TaxID=1971739 RepID=UPI0032D93AA7
MAQTAPLRRYSIGGKAPAVVADYSAGVYGLNGTPVAFDGLFSFSRLSAAWKLDALGHWVKVLAGEPRTGHHIWQGGQLVPAGQLVESATRTQEFSYSKLDDASLGSTFQTLGSDVTIQGGSTDIVTEVVATGTENGIPYIDWSVSGTNNAGTTQFYNVIDNRWVATSPGETYTISAYLKLISGSLGASTGTVQLYGHYRDAGNALIGQVNSEVISDVTDALQRFSGGGQAAPVGTVNLAAKGLFVRVPDGNSINIVLRIGLPQVESGGVSTSPIVSAGSAVSVAAESSQIDPVSVAKAVGVFGPELWDDGAVVVGALWTDNGGGSYTKASGGGSALTISNGSVPNGSNIVFSVKVSGMTGGSYNININGDTVLTITNSGDYDVVAAAGSSPPDLAIIGGFNSDGTVSMISAKQVTMPEELTLLINGTMTRAKEPEVYDNAVPFRWKVDTDNYTDLIVSAYGAHTGKPYFRSKIGGTLVERSGPDDALALGVEEDFALAFVLSSTEIEGFYNGVSTGQIAHGGMANLLSAPLQLFPVGNATIKDFRIWPEALPSADMLEATG